MKLAKYFVTITGTSPLLQHRYGIDDGASTKNNRTRKQDDTDSYFYRDADGKICQPADHLIGALRKAGSKFSVKGSGKATYRLLLGSGVVTISPDMIPHLNQNYTIDRRPVVVQRARIVRSRPMLSAWSLAFTLEFDEDEISAETLNEILVYAGRFVGIGDFRPACGGQFGRFLVERFVRA
jgi:hypothetical protein